MKTVVGVFFGGKTVEHEVSILSALQVIYAIDKDIYEVVPIYITKNNEFYYSDKLLDINIYKDLEKLQRDCNQIYFTHKNGQMIVNCLDGIFKKELKRIDIAFPVVHGLNVEDGTLQGFLEMHNIPYVGCDITSSAVGMNKIIFKKVLVASDIPVIDYFEVHLEDFQEDEEKLFNNIINRLSLPIILKPANLGSSVGIRIVKKKEEFSEAMNFVFEFTDKILIEKCIVNLKEINCSVIGNYEIQEVSELEEPVKADEILSFKDKYMSSGGKGTKSSGMASLTRKIPADISIEMRNEIIEISKKVFKVLDCEGVSRIDYIIDNDTNKVFVNEINTIPGSLSFYLWEAKGVSFDVLCDKLIKLGIKRKQKRDNIIYSNDVNLLSMHSKK
ncbi:MAG: D-alanine--D-alanine ligase [Clostridia bacterium]|nr:D-alanine--D-alanine ligase [Clostridia bacterium]MDD4386152.1 D-alanine--D-alanine ligase [Clostridia bacterium]